MNGQKSQPDKTTLAVLRSLPFGVFYCDRSCVVRYINEPYAAYLGRPPEEIIGHRITEFIPSSRAEEVMRLGREELYQESSVFKDKTRILVNRIPIRDVNGQVTGYISQLLSVGNEGWNGLWDRLASNEKLLSRLTAGRTLLSGEIVTQDKSMLACLGMAARYAASDEPVLLTGPTGSGKELMARAIQRGGKRAQAPFVCVNCAAIPRDFINSELFGYAPGAFTGARKEGKPGLMEIADKGTLFLDEVGELPLESQGVLLRALETGEVQRLNSLSSRAVNIRLICATNKNLRQMALDGQFREDLFFRIAVLPLTIPPLRERGNDLKLLIRHFLKVDNPSSRVDAAAMRAMLTYAWPGNVRELRNALIYADIAAQNRKIGVRDLPPWIREAAGQAKTRPGGARAVSPEQAMKALRECGGNASAAARKLGLSRATLYARLKEGGAGRAQPEGAPGKTRA